MTRLEANWILDRLRAGEDFPQWEINLALKATGDLLKPRPVRGRDIGWNAGPRVARAERREREAA